jgi:hypothetical protein
MTCMNPSCDKRINPQTDWTEVTGFDRPRVAGGTNAISMRATTGRYLCDDCMRKWKLGISPNGQASMF